VNKWKSRSTGTLVIDGEVIIGLTRTGNGLKSYSLKDNSLCPWRVR
jgi:hypothetical protein